MTMTHDEVTAAMKAEDAPGPIALALAEALNSYETSGLCPLRGACGLCDCGADEQSPEWQAEDYERALDRARYALAAVLPEIQAPIAELATLIAGILNLAADATEIEHGAPFTWEEVAKKRGRALDEISDRIIAFEPPTDRQTATEEPK